MGKFKKNEILIRLICVLLSVGLWVYIINVENPNRVTTFRGIPVQIKNAESLKNQKLILVPNQDFKVNLTIEGPANQVFNARNSSFSLSVDLSQFTLKVGENDVPLKSYDKIPDQTRVVSSDQFIKVKIDELAEKSVDIKKDGIKYTAAEGFYVPEPQIDSSVAWISGPKTDVDKVAALVVMGNKENISSTHKELLKVVPVDAEGKTVDNITSSKSYVEVTYTALEVRKDIPVRLKTTNTNTDIYIRSQTTLPTKVSIAAKESVLNNIKEIETAPIDLLNVKPGQTDYPVKLVVPSDVTVLDEEGKQMDPLIKAQIISEPLKSRTVSKELSISGKPITGTVQNTGTKIRITVSNSGADLDTLNEALVTAGVDVSDLAPGTYSLPVNVVVPEGYSIVSTTPSEVSITIAP